MKDLCERYGTTNHGYERTLCNSIVVVHRDSIENLKKKILGHEY